jgi:8-oxo-dGTP pyrophosphatase MutT (NUDIX family)
MIVPDFESQLSGDNLIPFIVKKLGEYPVDYSETMDSVIKSRHSKEPVRAAGVLLLLQVIKKTALNDEQNMEFSFLLIKRSHRVSQPGDLSCPGGMLNRIVDPFLRPFITGTMLPILTGKSREYALSRDANTFRIMTLLLTNAIRETWEETNLCPSKIVFLGPLPTYSLYLFKRAIFPFMGFVKETWDFHPNSEVDRIVEIPLKQFFQENNYGVYHIEFLNSSAPDRHHPRTFPCLIYRDDHGREDVLWGATFHIIMNFLDIVFKFKIPESNSKRIITRILDPNYLKGH